MTYSERYVAIGLGYYVLVGMVWFLIVLVCSSLIGANFHVTAFCGNKKETRKIIALTFDDGPGEMTLPMLDVLKKYNAPATFFCIGKNIEQHPEILQQVVAAGHTIGNHSYSHAPLFDFYRKRRLIDELRKTDALIERITGKKTAYFRPPYGVTNPSIRRALAVTKHRVIGWNIRSMDGISKNEAYIFNRIKSRVSPGSILLLHDTRPHTVPILEQLMVFLQEQQYTVVTVDQLSSTTP